jgi:hypothetical protein
VEPSGVPCNRHHQFFRADHVTLARFGCLVSGGPQLFKVCVHMDDGLVKGNDILSRIVSLTPGRSEALEPFGLDCHSAVVMVCEKPNQDASLS